MPPPEEPTTPPERTGEPRLRLLVVAAATVAGPELRDAVAERAEGRGRTEVYVIAPALTETKFEHVAGSIDDAIAGAQDRLERSLAELREAGVEATGATGDSDLRLAIEDALREFEADEILLVAHRDDPPPLERDGIAEAERVIEPPITELYVTGERDESHIADVEEVARGTSEKVSGEHEGRSPNMPPFALADVGAILIAVVGTLVLVVLAANCGDDQSLNTRGGFADDDGFGGCELRLLLAGGLGLVNIAHIVGLTLFQAGPYTGFWRTFFSRLSLIGTPAAIVVSLLVG